MKNEPENLDGELEISLREMRENKGVNGKASEAGVREGIKK